MSIHRKLVFPKYTKHIHKVSFSSLAKDAYLFLFLFEWAMDVRSRFRFRTPPLVVADAGMLSGRFCCTGDVPIS